MDRANTTTTSGNSTQFHCRFSMNSTPKREVQPTSTASAPFSRALSASSVQHSLIAGYIAGITGTLVGYPFDSAKVWVQTTTSGNSSRRHHHPSSMMMLRTAPSGARAVSSLATASLPATTSTNITTALNAVLKGNQVWQTTRALYRGVCGPLVSVGLVQSINFGIYDATRRLLYASSAPSCGTTRNNNNDYLQDDSLLRVGVASTAAGVVLSFITSPLVMIKTKQQVQQISFAKAARQTFGSTWSLRAVSRGFAPHFTVETCGRAIYFVTYEKAKAVWSQHVDKGSPPSSSSSSISTTGRMASASVAGMICWTIIFPLDVVRNRLFASPEYLSTWAMSQRIYSEYGVRGFFRGYGISVVRAGPVAAMVLPIYDYVLEHMQEQQQQQQH